ncbi:MAG: hypothetical protein S4CHLAM37_08630 [Chlamydiia bacterium]|nr:hypothetical protein [Chlamydiia bacterium]
MKPFYYIACTSLILCSCAVKNDYADVNHKPSKTTQVIDHPGKKPILIEVKDEREEKETVGYIQNSLGMKTAKIFPKEELSASLLKAMQDEMIAKGFIITEGGLKLLVTIDKCYVDYESNLFAAKSVADLQMNIHVLSEDGDPLYFKKINTKGIQSPIFLYSGKNAAKALNKALKSALSDLTLDQYFISCLVGETPTEMIAQD